MVQNPADADDCGNEVQMKDVESDIKDCMGNGKKHFLCSDYPAAITCFQDACALLSEKYGQTAEECSDAYYYYGVSLLELARMENGVLGNALKGVPEEEESDKDEEQFEKPNLEEKERLELRETVEAAMATEDEEEEDEENKESNSEVSEGEKNKDAEASSDKADDNSKKSSEDQEQVEDKSPEKETKSDLQENCAEPCSSKCDDSKVSQGADEELDDPDDIPNMQLAWEMLELAKILYLKKEKSKDNTLMVAQCHLKLGELGLELENYTQAIGDFLECLVLQKDNLPDTDRKLAETHYNLGLAYTFEKRYNNAVEHYQNSLQVLEARVELLEKMIEDKENDSDQDEALRECKEIGEIKELIPDINSKIEDVIGLRKETSSSRIILPTVQSGETTIGFGSDVEASSVSCSVIPVKKATSPTEPKDAKESTCDITHLVRRKRASPDESTASFDGSGDCKKMKQEPIPESKDTDTKMEESNGPKKPTEDETESACKSITGEYDAVPAQAKNAVTCEESVA